MMNGNCNGPTTNAPENQTSFDWNAYLPMGNIQPSSTYFLQIPVRPICNPGNDCLGGLAFEMCRIRWGKNAEISNVCPTDPCDENASCLYDGATAYCECNSGYEGDGFTCDEISWPTEQTCELPSGWSLISTYMDPVDPDLVQILMGLQSVDSEADILDWIIIAKNYLGAAYLPQWDFNGIGDWLMGQAYQLKTTAETSLTITGTYLLPELNPINLVEGWNMVGYLRLEPADMTAVFQDITNEDNLIIAKDYLGAAYLPEYGFNGIGNMKPCQGYQVKVLQADILEYHANDEPY
jgi:hypothetical protein